MPVKRDRGVSLVGAVGQVTDEQRRRAARVLASGAEDAEDLRVLLDAAGLTAAEGKAGGGSR